MRVRSNMTVGVSEAIVIMNYGMLISSWTYQRNTRIKSFRGSNKYGKWLQTSLLVWLSSQNILQFHLSEKPFYWIFSLEKNQLCLNQSYKMFTQTHIYCLVCPEALFAVRATCWMTGLKECLCDNAAGTYGSMSVLHPWWPRTPYFEPEKEIKLFQNSVTIRAIIISVVSGLI